MLDRLMRRPVLADPNTVMREHINDPKTHQGREADRVAGVIAEHQKCAAIGDKALMKRDTVHDRCHPMLTDAIMDVATGKVVCGNRWGRFGLGLIGIGEISRAADNVGGGLGEDLKRCLACLTARHRRLFLNKLAAVILKSETPAVA